MNINIKIKQEQIDNLIITALEGGSNYWYALNSSKELDRARELSREKRISLSEAISKLLYTNNKYGLDVYDTETQELLGTLSKESIIKGIEKAADDFPHAFSDLINDSLDIYSADTLFQLCVMGEVIFS